MTLPFFLCCSIAIFAQQGVAVQTGTADSVSRPAANPMLLQPRLTDTLSPRVRWDLPPARQPFNFRKALLPAAMIAYGVVSLKTDGLQDWNEKVKEEIWTEHPHTLFHLDNYLQYAPVAAVYGLNMMGIKGKNNLRDRTMILGISAVIMTSATFTVKKFAGEWRPDGSDRLSFPSGHTANAFMAAEFMRQEYKDVSPWYGIAGYLAAGATGALRMYNNKHWLGDVVAGAGVGILSTDVAYYIYPYIKRKLFKNRPVSTMVMPTYQNGAVGLGLVHTF